MTVTHQEEAAKQEGMKKGNKKRLAVTASVVILLVAGAGAYLLSQPLGQSQNVNACTTATASPSQLQGCINNALSSGPSAGAFKLQSYGPGAGFIDLVFINTKSYSTTVVSVALDGQSLQYDPTRYGKAGTWWSPFSGNVATAGAQYELAIFPPTGSQVTGTHTVRIDTSTAGSAQFTITL